MQGLALEFQSGYYGLSVKSVPVPPVGEGEVLVRVHASAVNHMDVAFLH